jgi:putative chitinase
MSIAARHQTTAAAIAARNGLADPNSISVGQTLVIPVGGATSETPGTSTVRHVVKGGETLSQIARTYRTTPKDILAANSTITDPDHLQVGSVLTITVGSAPAARTHRVRAGESLASIARRYGITIEALAQANGLSNPNRVRVGQVLVIP